MLPSLLTHDIKTGLKQFLTTGFEPSDAFLHGLMHRLTQDEASWLKGPYVQIGLPFVNGQHGTQFFSAFQTQYPGYSHQEQAWKRLSSQHLAASTLVATGTGSGKTECFLYPVLDDAARARSAGETGIKALVIYPMNALAADQARRIAQLVDSVPAFRGLRVGLYVGGQTGAPGTGMMMTPDAVITDRDTLRKQPPDILLTNYKMLDYLMLRPKDRQLWAANTPETLRYVVVDELHTFDGAQGTDLALLLRRLRARLQTPAGHLICAGTSATLGGASDTTPLRDYARQIFGVPFEPDSVVTENRQSVGEFLEDATVDYIFQPRPESLALLEPSRYASAEAAVLHWYGLFFADQPAPKDATDPAWRQQLGQQLKQHQLFVNLLKHLKDGVADVQTLQTAFARNLPEASDKQLSQIIDALLVLVAWARREGDQPLVNLRMQLWVRELRRMVGKLSPQADEVTLRSERDLPSQRDGVYLPMVQCRQCHTTGWISRLVQGSSKLSTQLDEIYNTWFAHRPEATRFYAAQSVGRTHVDGIHQFVCVACGNLQMGKDACLACGNPSLLAIFRVTAQRTRVSGTAQFTHHDTTCPACGERDELLLLGARNATLGAQVVEATWASVFNDDKKLIAFSDSVQDAAHRAGFFGARTYQNTVRTALAQAMDELVQAPLPWSEFLTRLEQQFQQPTSVLHMDDERLVSEFIGPNMTWQRDWATELPQHQHLPPGSRLPARVKKRFLWQAFSDMTYLSRRGRTLERIGKATLSVPWARLAALAETLTRRLQEDFGARGLSQAVVTQWLWGLLTHMRQRGGVMHPELTHYAADGNAFALPKTAGRNEWMPIMGENTPRPIFLTLGSQAAFDKLKYRSRASWYERWATAILSEQALLVDGMAAEMTLTALTALEQAGILLRSQHHQGDTLALNPAALLLDTHVAMIATSGNQRRLAVPSSDAPQLLGMPCLDAPESRYDIIQPQARNWWASRYSLGSVRRVIAAEHTGLLQRTDREALEQRFKDKQPKPWFENLLSATPTLEMGVDIGDLSSVLLCSVPPAQASFLQRIGRAGRVDGNAVATTLADGNSPHDLYFFAETEEMMAGEVSPPGIFLQAAEVLRRQLFAFCMDDWVAGLSNANALPHKTSPVLDAVEQARKDRFPYVFCDHVLQHEQRLFDAFMALLADDATPRVRERLWNTLQGQGEDDGLRVRLVKVFSDLAQERRTYKKRKDELDKARARLAQRPQDEATRNEAEQLTRERDSMLELIKEINGRDLLNTLTDAGLIPNYAFPEAGVELKSVLWRKRASDEPGTGAYVTLKTLTYERPAQSALSEFAPDNRFYANQRRVQVDQINMSLAKAETWRFCPSCHHMQNLDVEPIEQAVCPRCADTMWADAAQKRTLLRFRQAIANSDDTQVRIDDRAEDREPKYYVRQLMADFQPSSIREAWKIASGELPFGFEFISRVTFRDVNFGEIAKPGEAFKVADVESARPGFSVCRHCGKVQKPPRRHDTGPAQTHSFDCPKHGSDDPANLLECLYLYREFDSEALRILVPYTKNGVDERVVQSFMAAVQLGLKKRFGGKVDHLRMVMQDEPGKDGGPRKHYVLLYDSVPGGTGYLHQLLAQDAKTLAETLHMALDTLKQCACNADPDKDGCYRCLYQYRLGRNMQMVSRECAKTVLSELVKSLGQLEQVDTISDIYINPNFDSVLEGRFIECLSRMSGVAGLPNIQVVSDIINGKPGYVLEVGKQRYRIEPQCPLGTAQGVTVPSQPDFVIWPWASASKRKPIAVFCDGWLYHQHSIREDAHKRSAIVNSGAFWVWSVTHQDVVTALAGAWETDLESPLTALSRHDGSRAPAHIPRAQQNAFTQHAITRLLQWLASPSEADRPGDAALDALQRNALWASFLCIPNSASDKAASEQDLAHWLPHLPGSIHDPNTPWPRAGFAPYLSRTAPCLLLGCWPLALASGTLPQQGWSAPGMVVLDAAAASNDETLHLAWRRWLQLYNAVQVLPGMLLTSRDGLEAHDYDTLHPVTAGETVTSAHPDNHAALQEAWLAALEQTLSELQSGLAQLARAGAPIPEIGLELLDDRGTVCADAEMAWPDAKLAVLRQDQIDLEDAWHAASWTTLLLDETYEHIGHQPWLVAVAAALDLTLVPETQE
ncbi:MAG: DEAD/DEAH box helicase [Castellaniella sp.]|uniref:DEAD/DEAH box helicase n=1 Tax=unclassified Castellaniella TaxID=2617606 RepID=UPI00331457AB|nr:DEAD/DEAH box helicase [Castellaniella sp.]